MAMTTKGTAVFFLVAGMVAGGAVVWYFKSPETHRDRAAAPVLARPKPRILYWANPMNPAIHADHPMKDSMGMRYTPVYAPASSMASRAPAGLAIDPRLRQSLGVRWVRARYRGMGRTLHTVGTVAIDQDRVYAVNPHFSGWVEHLAVRAVGDPVRRGEVLAWVYAPALYAAEREYLLARESRGLMGGRRIVAAARARLRLLGLDANAIDALARRGHAARDVAVVAPVSGVVTALTTRQGGYLSHRHDFMEIANLDRVWCNVALYSAQLPWVRVGDPVQLTVPAYPGRSWTGRVGFIYPTLDAASRTVTARLSIATHGGMLRPGLYADATVLTHPRRALAIPTSAVLRAHGGDYVMLARPRGHFLPVQVLLGPARDGWVTVKRGLAAGAKVVYDAQFLLYSESQFQSVRARMLPAARRSLGGRS